MEQEKEEIEKLCNAGDMFLEAISKFDSKPKKKYDQYWTDLMWWDSRPRPLGEGGGKGEK